MYDYIPNISKTLDYILLEIIHLRILGGILLIHFVREMYNSTYSTYTINFTIIDISIFIGIFIVIFIGISLLVFFLAKKVYSPTIYNCSDQDNRSIIISKLGNSLWYFRVVSNQSNCTDYASDRKKLLDGEIFKIASNIKLQYHARSGIINIIENNTDAKLKKLF